MPIRFRCAYCNQLMGIARRKAGTVVRCPKCANQLMVPVPQDGDESLEPRPQSVPGPKVGEGGLFEQSDFGKVFEEGTAAVFHPSVAHSAAAPAIANPGPMEYDAVPLAPAERTGPRGIFVTSGVLAVICGLGVILMGMAFFLGMLVGRSSQ